MNAKTVKNLEKAYVVLFPFFSLILIPYMLYALETAEELTRFSFYQAIFVCFLYGPLFALFMKSCKQNSVLLIVMIVEVVCIILILPSVSYEYMLVTQKLYDVLCSVISIEVCIALYVNYQAYKSK